jgi:hypothetical protein
MSALARLADVQSQSQYVGKVPTGDVALTLKMKDAANRGGLSQSDVIQNLSTGFRQSPSRRNLPSCATQSPTPPNPALWSDRTYLWLVAHKRAPSFDTYRFGS